jgi:hypothetical protein
MPEKFRDNFWGQKCSAIGKRLGTTDVEVVLVRNSIEPAL